MQQFKVKLAIILSRLWIAWGHPHAGGAEDFAQEMGSPGSASEITTDPTLL